MKGYMLLAAMTIDDYVIGRGESSFCKQVEQTTKLWASIQGATSEKFGVYFGKTKQDPTQKYRATKKFGSEPHAAFAKIKAALLDLIALGQAKELDFAAIDQNPLSQMFKAKILSLYFPERFLNICSAEHLADVGTAFKHPNDLPSSQHQHLLLTDKNNHPVTRGWYNTKFTAYLYEYILGQGQALGSQATAGSLISRTKPQPKEVDFDRLLDNRKAIGAAAEAFALAWEQDRLRGMGLDALIKKIEDRRSRPGYGYDFLSHSAAANTGTATATMSATKSTAAPPVPASPKAHQEGTKYRSSARWTGSSPASGAGPCPGAKRPARPRREAA